MSGPPLPPPPPPQAAVGGDSSSSSSSSSTNADKAKKAALGALFATGSLMKKGFKAVSDKAHESESFLKLKANWKLHTTKLPAGLKDFVENPSVDKILANPDGALQVASILHSISHPKAAVFSALTQGATAAAVAHQTSVATGGKGLSQAEALNVAKASGSSSITSKFVPTAGTPAHGALHALTGSVSQARATGAAIDPSKLAHTAAMGAGAAHVSNAINQKVSSVTGLSSNVKLSTGEMEELVKIMKTLS